MRFALIRVSALLVLVLACGDDGGESSSVADASSSSSSTITTPTESSADEGGAESSTGTMLECDANLEFALADGVELGATSVDAVRHELGGDVQYAVTILGDAVGATQLDIAFAGTPIVGTEYQATALMQVDLPVVALLPAAQGEADFQTGTVTYTIVGSADGDELALEFRLEFMRGTVEGCVHTDLAVDAG